MKQIQAAVSDNSDEPEIVVHDNSHSITDMASGQEDVEPTFSISPKSSRSARIDGRSPKSRSSMEGTISPKSPRSPKSPKSPKSPRSSKNSEENIADVSREPPHYANFTDSARDDPVQHTRSTKHSDMAKRSEPVLPQDFAQPLSSDPPSNSNTQFLIPSDMNKNRSTKSTTGSRRSSSHRRKQRTADYDAPEAAEVTSSSLHGMFNGHLMKWRFEAEEGGPFVRVPAFFGATTLILTTTYALIFDPKSWTILSICLSLVIYAIALLGLVLEGRFMCSNPLGIRAHLRSALTRKNRVFRFVWGRGLLYILAGGLSCALFLLPSIVAGLIMVTVGAMAVLTGGYSSRKFYSLRDSLKDEDYLASIFNKYDYDGDGFITLPEFVNMLSFLGMDLDDRFGIKAFHAADINHDYKISYEDFQSWWKSAFLKNGKSPRLDDITAELNSDEEEGSYHRLS